MNILCCCALLLQAANVAPSEEQPRLTRILYDVVLISGERRLNVDLVLNLVDDQHFSISCRKNPGGLLFTCWATPERNYLVFPKLNAAFEGTGDTLFGLFPGGPEMNRAQWLLLLYRRSSGPVGAYNIVREDGWRVLNDEASGFSLRWRETNRLFKSRYGRKVLEPQDAQLPTYPIGEMKIFLETHLMPE